MDLTSSWIGLVAVAIFVTAYILVILEENIHLRKSKPVIVAAGFIWMLVAFAYSAAGDTHSAEEMVRHNLLEFAELFLFLLAAMTFINTMEERGIFNVLRAWLVNQEFSLRQVFWITGIIAFLMSPVADNLATALLMATVVISSWRQQPPVCCPGLYQHRGCCQCRRGFQSVWRYHHTDGMAKRPYSVQWVLCIACTIDR